MLCRAIIVGAVFTVKHTAAIIAECMQNPWSYGVRVCDFGRENIIVVGNAHTQKQYPSNFRSWPLHKPANVCNWWETITIRPKKFLFDLFSFFFHSSFYLTHRTPHTRPQQVDGGLTMVYTVFVFSLCLYVFCRKVDRLDVHAVEVGKHPREESWRRS